MRPWRALSAPAVVLALTLAVLAISCATARADGFVQVDTVGGGSRSVALSELGKPDVTGGFYSSIATPGGGLPQSVTVTSGYSLSKLFKYLKIGPTSFGSAEIVPPEGPPIVLNSAQVTSATAFDSGPAVVWGDGAGTHFLLPSTPSGTTNAGETFTGTIIIQLHSGTPLALSAYAIPQNAIIDKPVQFHSGAFGGSALTYQWSFGDGTTGSAAEPSHVYSALGTYNVYLAVTGTDDTVGVSQVIHIVVGNPPKLSPNPGAGTGGTGGSGSTGGVGTGGSGGTAGTSAGGHGASTSITSSVHRHATKRSRHRRAKPLPRPTGPLVSGIEISYISPAASSAAAAAGAAQAARAATARARAAGLDVGMWIWFVVLVMLFGGALLEWSGSRQARLAMAKAS